MSTPIRLRALRKAFGSTAAVAGIDLDIKPGDLFFLLGPSGCGKTTLLRMIAGFTDPTSGLIEFGDQDVTHLPPNKRNCGMVFQGYALWPHMTVRQNVAFGLGVRRVSAAEQAQRVDEALASVHMTPYADRKPNQLSGGQQQRVALARALVIKPTVLLLDEPLSNLDAKLRLEMRSQIKQVCKQAKITAVYVTHDQKEALSMADGIAVLQSGKVVQTGQPRELYDRPNSRFVADFLGETNFIPASVKARDGKAVVLESSAGVIRSHVFPQGLAVGAKVTCSVRPEAIQLLPGEKNSDNGINQLFARRSDLIYLGEIAQHLLAVGDASLKAFELNPRGGQSLSQSLCIGFDPDDVVVLLD